MPKALLAAAALFAFSACIDNRLEPLPLQIGIQASRVMATPGDTINFLVSTQGGSLIGVEIDFADGTADNYLTSGARRAIVTFRHAYQSTGVFQVDAKVTDAEAGSKNATIQVTVN